MLIQIVCKCVNNCFQPFLQSKIKNNLPYNIGYVKARDKDSGTNGEIRYYLKQDYNAFSIDSENGTLYVRGHLDCCDVVYGLTVEARDEGIPPRHDEVEISVMAFYPKTGTKHLLYF